jgi:hypothetical protein
MTYFLCGQPAPDRKVVVIEQFYTLEEAVISLEVLMAELPDHHFWMCQVPPKQEHLAEPIIY